MSNKTHVAEPQKAVSTIETRLERLEKQVENFLAKFGTYYNSEGHPAFFVVDRFVNGGANGVALTPNQGMIEQFALPMRLTPADRAKEPDHGPYWVPEIIPKEVEKAIEEEFGADGDNPKADN